MVIDRDQSVTKRRFSSPMIRNYGWRKRGIKREEKITYLANRTNSLESSSTSFQLRTFTLLIALRVLLLGLDLLLPPRHIAQTLYISLKSISVYVREGKLRRKNTRMEREMIGFDTPFSLSRTSLPVIYIFYWITPAPLEASNLYHIHIFSWKITNMGFPMFSVRLFCSCLIMLVLDCWPNVRTCFFDA